jgi:enamidase
MTLVLPLRSKASARNAFPALFAALPLLAPAAVDAQAPVSELDMTTWSIAALDPETGDVGISMASCVPETFGDGVGALVPGHGVVATQAAWNLDNRNRAYDALREGLSAQAIIDRVVEADTSTARRQYGAVTMKDGVVEVAGFTGDGTSDWAGIMTDREMAVTAQGNTLVSEAVVADALAAFVRDDPTGKNTLADRLMRALEAGSKAGGDVRCNREGITSTAATAMILVARGDDPPYAARDIGLTDEGSARAPWLAISHHAAIKGPNPILDVRRRFDAWRAAQPELVVSRSFEELAPEVQEFVAVSSPHVVIRDVRLIDGTGAEARSDMAVEILDGRIVRVGASADVGVPDGAEVVDGAGHTLMPGLVMLHEHLFYPSGRARYNTNEHSFPPLYLAGGVTTMRTGGSVDTYTDLRVRQHIDEGRIPGPHMDVTAPYLEGPNGFVRAMPQLATPEQARAHVNFWMDQGATSFKAYNFIERVTLAAAIEAAHARGAKVTGHLCSITYREAAELGIDNLEHGFFAATDWVQGKEPDSCPRGANQSYLDLDLSSPDFTDVVEVLVERGVAVTSTLTVVERRAPDRGEPPVGAQEAMLPQLHERVMAGLGRGGEQGRLLLEKYMAMEKAFYDAGGFLVVGTDPTGGGDVVPGYANQRALQLLVEMGLSVEEAVEVATRNGARYLERDSEIGTVEEGKRADLVLLRGDPTSDVAAFRNTALVFKDGVGFDSAKLFDSVRGWVGVR